MTTATTNYGWGLPADGGDFDNWGVELNAVIQAVDGQVKANDTAAQGYASAAQSAAQGTSLQKGQNLADLASLAAAWGNLGVGITTNGNGSYIQIGPLLVQWQSAVSGDGSTRGFPKTFSTSAGVTIVPGNSDSQGADSDTAYAYVVSASQYVASTKASTGSNNTNKGVSWIAVGPA